MSDSTNLQKAKMAKYDEFYTRYEDVERTIEPFRDRLVGEHIYCNCDNPDGSNYVRYFLDNFIDLGLSELTATYYDQLHGTVKTNWRLNDKGEILRIETKLEGDGSFDSDECLETLDECSIVVTNPPFSIFNKFFASLLDHDKDFIIVGPMLKVQCKDFREALFAGRVHTTGLKISDFICADDYDDYHKIDDDGNKIKNVQAVIFSSFPVNLKPDFMTMYSKKPLQMYDDYPDIANVDRLRDIPIDYDGKMGVPITFLYTNYEQYYDVLGFIDPMLDGKNVFKRVVIKKKKDVDK